MSDTSLRARPAIPLPHLLTPLLGRDREVTELMGLLSDPALRLVTITGPGGIGKTRLALHVASALQDGLGGQVVFVPLAAIHQASLVVPAIGQAFGMVVQAGEDDELELAEVLQGRPVLLVLDNLEQVLDVAPIIGRLLDRCPDLTILATSQVPLGLDVERAWPLGPLPTPDHDQTEIPAIRASDAVALFMARARAVDPTLELNDDNAATIAEICRRLDGLPLAIELAAARSNILSPTALLTRLKMSLEVLAGRRPDVPDRLRTMRNAIAWSYDLLDEREQALFRRLAVFTGGFSREAVAAIAPDSSPGMLWTLVERSLILRVPLTDDVERLLMLETLRAYGHEQLALRGEEGDVRDAHAAWCVALAERAEPHLSGDGLADWHERLDLEIENIRAAVEWLFSLQRHGDVLRIGGALWRYMSARGLLREARDWLDRALAVPGGDPGVRARALVGLGYLCDDLRELDAALSAFEQARHLAGAIGDRRREAHALTGLGTVAHDRGEYDAAMELHTAAMGVAREAGDIRGVAVALGSMGIVSYYQGRLEEARRHWEECTGVVAGVGDMVTETQLLGNLGAVSSEMGDFAAAERYLERALQVQRRLNLQNGLPYSLINYAEATRHLGDVARARAALDEALVMLRETGNRVVESHALNGLARIELAEGNIETAARTIIEGTRLILDAGDPHTVIDNAEVVAMICSARELHEDAVELVSASTQLRLELGAEPTPIQRQERHAVDAAARAALPGEVFDRRWLAGTGMDIETLGRRIMAVARRIVGPTHASPAPTVTPTSDMTKPRHDYGLTPREIEVLRLLAQGEPTARIAEQLSVSPRTAATHITNLLGKLGVRSRTAAVALALREGIL